MQTAVEKLFIVAVLLALNPFRLLPDYLCCVYTLAAPFDPLLSFSFRDWATS